MRWSYSIPWITNYYRLIAIANHSGWFHIVHWYRFGRQQLQAWGGNYNDSVIWDFSTKPQPRFKLCALEGNAWKVYLAREIIQDVRSLRKVPHFGESWKVTRKELECEGRPCSQAKIFRIRLTQSSTICKAKISNFNWKTILKKAIHLTHSYQSYWLSQKRLDSSSQRIMGRVIKELSYTETVELDVGGHNCARIKYFRTKSLSYEICYNFLTAKWLIFWDAFLKHVKAWPKA